ncbi:MAG: DUF4430 domain-containing protein [Clostridia bacterium]|nr:DUF4430 domain-containing protein [Clostridia bacterium]
MKRFCAALCVLIVLLTACGRPSSVQPDETQAPQTLAAARIEIPDETTSQILEPQPSETDAAVTETTAKESVTELPATTAAETTQTTAAATAAAATRQSYTLFSIPVRTTAVRTTTAPAPTQPRTTAPTTKPTTATTTVPASNSNIPSVQPVQKTCTVTIDCTELKEHPEKLKAGKAAFVPESGYIVRNVTVPLSGGESAFDVLRTVCRTHTCTDNCAFCQKEGIQMESTYTPQFDSYYVEGIHQLYEKDCGGTSGWTYFVNGWFPNYSSSAYTVKPGDRIEWVYSIEMDERESF